VVNFNDNIVEVEGEDAGVVKDVAVEGVDEPDDDDDNVDDDDE